MSAPYQPFNVVLQTGNGQNFLTWDITVGATSYQIQRSLDGVSFTTVGTSLVAGYLDSSVSIGVTYFYQVAALNGTDMSAYAPSYPTNITPCLPGQINLGYLRYMSKLRADKLNSEYLTTDEWNFNLNQSSNTLYNMLVTNYGDNYFFAPPLLLFLTGLQSYTLPNGANYIVDGSPSPALYKLAGVDLNISGQSASQNAGWIPLARTNWSDRDRFTTFPGQAGSLFYGYQLSYAVMGDQLYVFPPNTNTTLRLWYVPRNTQMLQDTDMMSFSISGWCEFVINDAAKKAMIKEESLEKWNALTQANAAIISEIEASAKNRDVSMPPTVSNTRATCGDPGFGGWSGGSFGGGAGGWSF